SWVGYDLNQRTFQVEHSVTCSTGLHAIANATAWIRSEMIDRFLIGASEAPLTPFTIAQLKALSIYRGSNDDQFPCRPFGMADTKSTVVLGEGSVALCLGDVDKESRTPLAIIDGIGYYNERISSPTSMNEEGEGLYQSMKMALGGDEDVSAIVVHAPGTP